MEKPRQPLFESVPLRGPVSVALREFSLPAFTHPWHRHPEVELTWILEGAGLRYVGDSVEPFAAGDFCLIGANLPHAWLSTGAARRGRRPRVRSLVVQFDPRNFGNLLATVPELAETARLLERAERGLQFSAAAGARIRERFGRARDPLGRFTALLDSLGVLAAEREARPLSLAPWRQKTASDAESRLRRVFAYLNDRVEDTVSHAECARLAGLSPPAFSRFFRRALGRSFQDYVTDLRLGLACRQLLTTDRSISEIAYAAGFGNLSNFNRSFRLRRDMTPREYRQLSLGRRGHP